MANGFPSCEYSRCQDRSVQQRADHGIPNREMYRIAQIILTSLAENPESTTDSAEFASAYLKACQGCRACPLNNFGESHCGGYGRDPEKEWISETFVPPFVWIKENDLWQYKGKLPCKVDTIL